MSLVDAIRREGGINCRRGPIPQGIKGSRDQGEEDDVSLSRFEDEAQKQATLGGHLECPPTDLGVLNGLQQTSTIVVVTQCSPTSG